MATHKRVKTRFTGVFTRTTSDPKRKHNGRPDRVFDIYWRDADGKQCWEVVGWLSEGMTEQAAFNLRTERLAAVKKSASFSPAQGSLLTGAQQTQLLPEEPQKPELDIPLFSTIAENYLRWLEGESKYADRERFRYDTHLREPLGGLHVNKISITDADKFKHQLMPKMAIGTTKKCLNLCRAIFFYASLTGVYSGMNPFSRRNGFKMPKGATECERFLTPDEAKTLLVER
jgi:hypothetical protein